MISGDAVFRKSWRLMCARWGCCVLKVMVIYECSAGMLCFEVHGG